MFIRSERLFLRPGWPEDWSELHGQVADEAIVRNLAKAPWPYTAEAAREFASLPQQPRYPHFMITLPTGEGSRLIGAIGLTPAGDSAEVGYWIAHRQWNRGYATEAIRAVLRLAGTLGHHRFSACHFADNPASGRVLRKVGFIPTGQVGPRYSLARGHEVEAQVLALEIGAPSDCDGSNPDAMRAA